MKEIHTRAVMSIAVGMVALMGFYAGCHSDTTSSDASAQSSTPTTRPIPPDSPFAKVTINESMQEVYATIGPPTSTTENLTGKSWIPGYNYWGGDQVHLQALYKGLGVITFGGSSQYSPQGMWVREVSYDPDERGYPQ